MIGIADWHVVPHGYGDDPLQPHVKRGEIKRIAVVQEIEKSTHTPQNNMKLDGSGMRNIAVFGFQSVILLDGLLDTYVNLKRAGAVPPEYFPLIRFLLACAVLTPNIRARLAVKLTNFLVMLTPRLNSSVARF